jgi:hypothetical protein
MAIDPMLYRKVSGKSGNPHDKLGQALASSSGRKQKRDMAGGAGAGGPAVLGLKVQWWLSIIASIGVLIVLFMMMM